MAKNTNAEPETVEATTGKAKAGSSIAAQCKALVMAIASELKSDKTIFQDTLDWLNSVNDEILESAQRNLPLSEKLDRAKKELNEIYTRAGVKDGVFAFASEEDENRTTVLTAKIAKLKKDIEKEREANKVAAEATEAAEATA